MDDKNLTTSIEVRECNRYSIPTSRIHKNAKTIPQKKRDAFFVPSASSSAATSPNGRICDDNALAFESRANVPAVSTSI